MTIYFKEPEPLPPPSLSCRLALDGRIRFRRMTACRLTYEDNEAEVVPVWVAVKTRREVIEVTEPEYVPTTRFRGAFI